MAVIRPATGSSACAHSGSMISRSSRPAMGSTLAQRPCRDRPAQGISYFDPPSHPLLRPATPPTPKVSETFRTASRRNPASGWKLSWPLRMYPLMAALSRSMGCRRKSLWVSVAIGAKEAAMRYLPRRPGSGGTAGMAAAAAVGLAALLAGAVLAVTRTPASAAIPGAAQPAAGGVGAGYWHTSGHQILDAAGNPVRIAGVNWYGFETPDEVAHGLWAQDYHAIINDIKSLGYNTIRIPFSNQMAESPIVPQNLSFYNSTGPINTDLSGLNSLQILDKIIAYAGQAGLKVILDDHRSEAGESAEANGLWYTSAYTSQAWVNDWVTLARRYAGNPTVVGFDLRNEPHTPTGDSYAQGATWGTGAASTDVRLAYQQAGNAILAADPGALIFCEGVSENPSSAGGFDSTWWG